MTKSDVCSVLMLKGMSILSSNHKLLRIDVPSVDFNKKAIRFTEQVNGLRRSCAALRFHGFYIYWHEDKEKWQK